MRELGSVRAIVMAMQIKKTSCAHNQLFITYCFCNHKHRFVEKNYVKIKLFNFSQPAISHTSVHLDPLPRVDVSGNKNQRNQYVVANLTVVILLHAIVNS